MLWRSKALLVVALFLSGCGFHSLYGTRADAPEGSKVMAGVKVDNIPNGRMGQQLKADLEDGLNPQGAVPPNPAYRLAVTLKDSTAAIGVARDGTVSRYNVYLYSEYALYRTSDGKEITAGNLRHVSSYNNITNAYFSTFVSQEDAVKRGIDELAQLYRQRLGAYFDEGAPEQAITPPGSENANPIPINPWQANPWQTNPNAPQLPYQ